MLETAKTLVFEVMRKRASPGWRPVAAELAGRVPVRLVQRYVSEYKNATKQKHVPAQKVDVASKNVIWSIDGAFTTNTKKVEHQVVKDRATKAWVGHSEDASKTCDVVEVLSDASAKEGLPLVISSDNGSAYKSKRFADYLRRNKVVHLRSLPRTPQHNGAVEVGIKELREIMECAELNMGEAVVVANERLRKYGKDWMSAGMMYKNTNVNYTENDRAEFFNSCERRLKAVRESDLGARKLRMREREIILDELKVRGYIKLWKVADNRG
jgi:transposase InsO family protein